MRTLLDKLNVTLLILMAPLFAPAARAQDTIRLAGKDTWDLYVHGNGDAIAQILTAVKLMLAPDSGGGGFRYLLLFLAIIGFVVLAVRAGFDPGRNFLKMFGFIFMIWAVMYGTTGARANVHIYDQMSGYSNIVTGVPALVAVPASIISQTGEWLTREIEQNFNIPGQLKVSESGQFNLFGRVLQEMNQFVITDANLSRSLKAYVSDCVVPSMALGRVSANDFQKSHELLKTLEKAKTESLLTRYYSLNPSGAEGTGDGLGDLKRCSEAYALLKGDLESHAQALVNAKNDEWAATGIMVPFEQAMSEALGQAAASGGGNPMARYGRPQGIILQKALLSHMNGAFRDAAVRTGNNELMTATAIAQAEQSQKSAWWTAAEIFKNMMGYVYLVLQAFIFAIVPIVIIGLMIPGLGGKIFTNYFQILVWLTMWTPMLAIVSFLMMVFGEAQLRETLAVVGLTMENSAVVTEASNNLVIAAQFIGTMVPLITWGLVKGAMAFTEFVSHGVGSAFATQAGAQAATGNVSMGNLSMDNTGMNKYSTTLTSAVGQQAVQADYGAGIGTATNDFGGAVGKVANQSINMTRSSSRGESAGESSSHQTGTSLAHSQAELANKQRALEHLESASQAFGDAHARLSAYAESESAGEKWSHSQAHQISMTAQQLNEAMEALNSAVSGSLSIGASAGFKGGKKGGGDQSGSSGGAGGLVESIKSLLPFDLSASADGSTSIQGLNQEVLRLADSLQNQLNEASSTSHDWGRSDSKTESASHGTSRSYEGAIRDGLSHGQSIQESVGQTWQHLRQDVHQLSYATTAQTSENQNVPISFSAWADSDLDVRPAITAGQEAVRDRAVTPEGGGAEAAFASGRREIGEAVDSGGSAVEQRVSDHRQVVGRDQGTNFEKDVFSRIVSGDDDVKNRVAGVEDRNVVDSIPEITQRPHDISGFGALPRLGGAVAEKVGELQESWWDKN